MNDLPDTPENRRKKSIVRQLGIKYERSNESGHIYHDQEGYFKQVKYESQDVVLYRTN